MNITAYDLDGVIAPDHAWKCIGAQQQDFTPVPVFQPQGKYFIVTSRLADSHAGTLQWCRKHLQQQPLFVFHDNENIEQPWLYKFSVLKERPYVTTFVENDPDTIKYLRQHLPKLNVIDFPNWVADMLHSAATKSQVVMP